MNDVLGRLRCGIDIGSTTAKVMVLSIALIAILALKHPAQAGAAISHAFSALGTLITNL